MVTKKVQYVENDSKGKNVACFVILDLGLLLSTQVDDLWRHIPRCPASDVHELRGIGVLSQSKVHNNRFDIVLTRSSDHDILKLDIAMHNIFLMQIP